MAFTGRRIISLDDLAVINQELAALARAGVPLEPGLMALARDESGRIGRFAAGVAASMESGKSLADAVAERDAEIGPLYRAVVEAGARSGRLSVALDGMASACQRLAETRRLATASLVYPLVVALLTIPFGLYLGFRVLPGIRVFRVETLRPTMERQQAAARQAVPMWAPATAAGFAAVGVGWWCWSRRSLSLESSQTSTRRQARGESAPSELAVSPGPTPGSRRGCAWLSWLWFPSAVRSMRREGQWASLAEILAELVAAGASLPAALRLAGRATGVGSLAAATSDLASQLEQGAKLAATHATGSGLPRLLIWALQWGSDPVALERLLRQAAETYRRSADRRAEWLTDCLPAMMSLSIGGTAVFTYALWLFVPWVRTLHDIAAYAP